MKYSSQRGEGTIIGYFLRLFSKRDGKRNFWSAIPSAPHKLGLRLMDASQPGTTLRRHQSEFRSAPRPEFWLLIGQSTGAGTGCPYPGSQSESARQKHPSRNFSWLLSFVMFLFLYKSLNIISNFNYRLLINLGLAHLSPSLFLFVFSKQKP